MASYLLPHRNTKKQNYTDEERAEMAALGIVPRSTQESFSLERKAQDEKKRLEKRAKADGDRAAAVAAEAQKYLRTLEAPGDGKPRKLTLSAQRLVKNGLHAHNYGLHKNALEAYAAALATPEGAEPSVKAEILAHRSATLRAFGQGAEALQCANEAVDADSTSPVCRVAVALAYDYNGDPVKAMDAIQAGAKCGTGGAALLKEAVQAVTPKLQALAKLRDAAFRGDVGQCAAAAAELDAHGHPQTKSLSWGEPRREDTALHRALAAGRADVVRWAGDAGLDANVPDADGDAPLAFLFFGDGRRAGDWRELAGLLLEAGADAGRVDASGATLFHRAAASGDADVCAWLFDRDRSFASRRDATGATPLHAACRVTGEGNEIVKHGMLEWLLVHGGPDLMLPRDDADKPPLAYLKHETDAVDARLKKWVSAWLRAARKAPKPPGGGLPPPPPYEGGAAAGVASGIPTRTRGFRADRPADDVRRAAPPRFKPELHGISIKSQYARFDAMTFEDEEGTTA